MDLTQALGHVEFDLFVKEVRKEMTVKCGQKCTAVRRIFVPREHLDAVQEALVRQLAKTTVGDPQQEGVRMGALVDQSQCQDVLEQVARLEQEAERVFGDTKSLELVGAQPSVGTFLPHVVAQRTPHGSHVLPRGGSVWPREHLDAL